MQIEDPKKRGRTPHEKEIVMAKQTFRQAPEPRGSSEIHVMHEDIAALAYAQWQKKGCPEGTQKDDSLRAEQELIAKREVAVQAPRS